MSRIGFFLFLTDDSNVGGDTKGYRRRESEKQGGREGGEDFWAASRTSVTSRGAA
jgi:hypothetical protein